ncbi:MAG: hypothetical protein ACT4P1_03055 [Sporichthyaceae bacterium]
MSNTRKIAGWSSGTGPHDRALSGLTPARTQRVRDLARAALAARGLEAVVHDDHLSLADGRVLGLQTLASVCHSSGLPEARWPAIVGRYLDDLLQMGATPQVLTAEQLRASTHVRLAHVESLSEDLQQAYSYARRIGAGFAEVLAHVEGDHVRFLTAAEVALVGYPELLTIGQENLRRITPDCVEELRRDPVRLHVVRGDSGFIASKVLLFDEVLDVVLPLHGPTGRDGYRDGFLVALPSRHELVLAPVDASIVSTLAALMEYAGWTYTHEHAPISPHVYWWCDGSLTALTTTALDGAIELRPDAAFLEVATRLLDGEAAA